MYWNKQLQLHYLRRVPKAHQVLHDLEGRLSHRSVLDHTSVKELSTHYWCKLRNPEDI
jgi:hypothetical protein